MAMAKPQIDPAKPASRLAETISGTGIVRSVDKAGSRVRLTHEAIAEAGWPKMTMFFKLKEASLADDANEGAEVRFTLEKSASGYVITKLEKLKP